MCSISNAAAAAAAASSSSTAHRYSRISPVPGRGSLVAYSPCPASDPDSHSAQLRLSFGRSSGSGNVLAIPMSAIQTVGGSSTTNKSKADQHKLLNNNHNSSSIQTTKQPMSVLSTAAAAAAAAMQTNHNFAPRPGKPKKPDPE